jgi:phosphonate metabolism-associated iron-containing alcohol dehydrogenase
MHGWTHFNPVRINFGCGCRAAAADALAGRRCLIVCSPRGRRQIRSDPLLREAVSRATTLIWVDSVDANPEIGFLQGTVDRLRGTGLECVLAVGGGSAIDSGKVLALALSPKVTQESIKGLVGVANELPLGFSLPVYAIPTTAGTGSEVTPFATLWDRNARQKISLSGPAVYPYSAYVDPSLSVSLPYDSTLNTGLDAINQAAESIWNRNMSPMTEMLAQRALRAGMESLPNLLNDLNNEHLRVAMTEVSLQAGLAISQTRTALCHAISYPLTLHFGIPHGLACAFTMPSVLTRNLVADDGRFLRLAKFISDDADVGIESLPRRFEMLNQKLRVAEKVRGMVGSLGELLKLCDQMFTPGRADNALVRADTRMVRGILKESWEK